MNGGGPEGDIVISTRIRLARNLSDTPFPGTMTEAQSQEVLIRVAKAIELGKTDSDAMRLDEMAKLSDIERLVLVEQHLISPVLAKNKWGGVSISEDRATSIMINEEDHLRIQCILPGLELRQAYEIADRYDDMIEQELLFAFHDEYGYLTACPTNAGTGMRASVMIHLPGLAGSGHIGRVLSAIGQFGLMARGLYGEGTQATGNVFQISNQVTSGLKEDEILKNLSSVVGQIVSQERSILKRMAEGGRVRLEDKVYRALGTLRNARVLTSQEAMSLLSDLRLGVAAGLLKDFPTHSLNELLVSLQPGALQQRAGRGLTAEERDVIRAECTRKQISEQMKEGN